MPCTDGSRQRAHDPKPLGGPSPPLAAAAGRYDKSAQPALLPSLSFSGPYLPYALDHSLKWHCLHVTYVNALCSLPMHTSPIFTTASPTFLLPS